MDKLIKEIPKALTISFLIFLVLLFIEFLYGRIKFENSSQIGYDLGIRLFYCMVYSLSLYFVNATIYIKLDAVFINNRYSPKRLIIGFVLSFVTTLFCIFLLRIFEDVIIEKNTLEAFLRDEKASNYVVSSVIAIIVLLGIHAFHFYKALQERKVTEQKIIAGTANAKFETLKNQIDPHFLFNSLNVLSSLIEENPENAQRFTTSLSKIYRYVLEQKDKELVSVAEELSFAKTYMNLLKMRFENSLFYELPETVVNPEAKVVPLSLQLLLENTVKHNVVSEQKPLHIRIFIEGDYLAIQNDYQKKEVLQSRQGVGLQNIVDRYGIITNRKVLIEQNEQTFTVKIPVLTKQISVMETTSSYSENNAYYRAKKRVEQLKGFYGNLISYCCVIPILIFINLTYTPKFHWFWFSAAGWGFGLTMHAFQVFGYGANWEERKIQEILRKEDDKQTWK
jgi:sensor histidine kinase YesM